MRQLTLIKGRYKLADSVAVPVREGEGDGLLLGVPHSVGQHRAEVLRGVGEDEQVGRHSLPVAADQPEVDQFLNQGNTGSQLVTSSLTRVTPVANQCHFINQGNTGS